MSPTAVVTVDVHVDAQHIVETLQRDAKAGLASDPKVLPPKWFYDERGSELFDEITRLDEYYPTRTERAILEARADEIARLTRADTLVELGSGTSEKTRLLLDATSRAGRLRRYIPFDVSEEVLRFSAAAVSREYPEVEVHAVVGDFEHHLDEIPGGDRRLVAFLGGTIGNFEPPERIDFFASVSRDLQADDSFLLGVDLVKDPRRLVAAYDDEAGVTAQFNKNVLAVLNHQLGADFDLDRFEHVARWNGTEERIEMWLRSTTDQSVELPGIEAVASFAAGEEMRTEVSYKFRRGRLEAELGRGGLTISRWWTDPDDDFALLLASRA